MLRGHEIAPRQAELRPVEYDVNEPILMFPREGFAGCVVLIPREKQSSRQTYSVDLFVGHKAPPAKIAPVQGMLVIDVPRGFSLTRENLEEVIVTAPEPLPVGPPIVLAFP